MATQKRNKNIDHYMSLNWTYTIEKGSHKGKDYFIIRVNELPGVCTDSESVEEGMKLIEEVMKATFELYLEQGDEIPEPIKSEDYKGQIAYRTSPTRHYVLAKEAKRRHLSLSRVIDECIDLEFGSRTAHA